MNVNCTTRDTLLAGMLSVIHHFPCDKVKLHNKIQDLKIMDKNEAFHLISNASHFENDPAVFEVIIKGLETGLDIEKYFALHADVAETYKNIHTCSVFFDNDQQIVRIVFTLKSCSRDVSFEVEFDKDFQFKWYDMYYFLPEKMLGTTDDSIHTLVDEMSYLAC